MRPVFCGNLDYDARQSEIERLFSKYGRVDRVDMKSGKTVHVHPVLNCKLPFLEINMPLHLYVVLDQKASGGQTSVSS